MVNRNKIRDRLGKFILIILNFLESILKSKKGFIFIFWVFWEDIFIRREMRL